MMTNTIFLREIFGPSPKGAVFTASVTGDPGTKGFPYDSAHIDDPKRNNFFCVSTVAEPLAGDPPSRAAGGFVGLYCIVIDDVGTKIDGADVLSRLGDPTWIVLTSPGNYQWGYKLTEPVFDRKVASGIIEAVCRVWTSDVAGTNRLVRLPVGVNGKAKYGKPSPKCDLFRVADWDKTVSAEFLTEVLGAVPVEVTDAARPFLPEDEDPVLDQMDKRSRPYETTALPGVYKVICPWVDEHTDGDSTGTAYIAPAGFKCHHGHCADKTFADFRKEIEISAKEVDKAIRDAAVAEFGESVTPGYGTSPGAAAALGLEVDWLKKGVPHAPGRDDKLVELRDGIAKTRGAFGRDAAAREEERLASTRPPDSFEESLLDLVKADRSILADRTGPFPPPSGGDPFFGSSVGRFHTAGRVMTKPEVEKGYPRQWLFKDIVLGNTPWLLASPGGVGKSRLALAMCMSAASGVPWGPFEPTQTGGVRTMFLTVEDDEPEKAHRYTTQLRQMQKEDARWKNPTVIARLKKNLYLPEVDPNEGCSRKFLKALRADQELRGPVQLAIWDPLIMFWDPEDEEGINSAAGTRKTIQRIVDVTRVASVSAGLPYSVGLLHHSNKSGGVLGSVMLENLVRTVFTLERDPTGDMKAILKIEKANGTAARGKSASIELKGKDAVVTFLGDFESLTRDERVARLLTGGTLKGMFLVKDLITRAAGLIPTFGETSTERRAVVKEVLDGWERLDSAGLHKMGIGREMGGSPKKPEFGYYSAREVAGT